MSAATNAATRARRVRQRQAGKCVDCGIPSGGSRRCAACSAAATERRAALRDRRHGEGRCIDCGLLMEAGGPVAPFVWHGKPTKRCNACAVASQDAERTRRASRVAAGKCVRCCLPAVPGKTMCKHCAEIHRQTAKESRCSDALRKAGKCPICGRRPEKGSAYCPACMAVRSRAQRKARTDRPARGLCVDCSRPRVVGRSRCVACLDAGRLRAAAKRVVSKQ